MDEFIAQLNNKTIIAVDTEFFRETSYYPKLALVQIATDSIIACIDPLAFDAKKALQKILLDENITKIIHSCSQDLEVLFYYLGKAPRNIYDTQIANALLTEQHQAGYASLVENELDVQLDKSQTRSNWLQRPLTKKQIQYAGDDVYYLYQVHSLLDEKLHKAERKAWLDEELSKLFNDENNFQVASDKLWQRVKGSTKLTRKKLAIVQSIALWREQLAQKKDKTRRKILPDDIIIQLAIEPPENTSILNQNIDHRTHFNDKEKQQLFETIQTALTCPENQWPDNQFTILDKQQKTLLKTLQQCVNNRAEKLGISSAVLCSRKELIMLIVSQKQQDKYQQATLNILQGWRLHCLGQHLLETIKNAK
jgi:ribonuclease D